MMTTLRRSLFLSLCATAMMLLAFTVLAQNKIVRAGKDKIENEYIVVLQDDVLPQQVPELARQIAGAHNARAEKVWQSAIKAFFVRMTEERAEQLSRHPLVKYVEENAQWYLSSSQQTNINPITCDPTTTNCPVVDDNRLWHLDRADQNYASPTNRYSYTSDGSNVTVYVVDTGVNKNHQEFAGSGRVQAGFNATADQMPADDPCLGFVAPATFNYEQSLYKKELLLNGHGTAVASALGGRRTGIAKNVTIVPIKVSPCDQNSGRERKSSQFYQQNQIMYHSPNGGATPGIMWRAQTSGVTQATDPGDWPNVVGTIRVDGGVTWKAVSQTISSTQTIIDGLDWILSPSNPGPKSFAVVTLSTYKLASDLGAPGVEQSIRSLLANNITVIASANNQNGNACDTTPGRMSMNNPDPNVASNVITAGGTMIINQPWTVNISDVGGNVADGPKPGGAFYGPEPAYDPTKAVREGRWICGPGDSSEQCSNNTLTESANPASVPSDIYYGYQGGSNAGPCVTLFAPAKNLFLAALASANSYRDARVRGGHASGTSWSAPIVAGFAARLLQNNPTMTPVQVRTAMLANSVSTLDAATLNTFNHLGQPITGTPNKLLKLSDVNITSQPASVTSSGPATLSVTAAGTSALSYQWYLVSSGFDLATYNYGAHSSTPIAGATSSTYVAPASQTARSYWVRVTNAGGSADSTIATVTPGQQCVPGVITQQPQSQTIVPGASATISVAVSGTGPFNYQFYQAPVGVYQNPIGLSTATINTGPLVSTKQYWAEINDTCQGTFLASNAAVITVQCTAAPTITQSPTSRVTSPNQSTTLSVSATQAVSYQWYQGTAPSTTTPVGTDSPNLTVAPGTTTNYWVRVTNSCGNASSATATVCVLPAISGPTSRTIAPGQSTTLTVTATNATSYQWYQGTAPSTTTPVGTNSNSLTVTPAATTSYWVRVTNSCGSSDSPTAVVTVALPQITRIQSASSLANSQTSITANWPAPTQAGTFLVAVASIWIDQYANFTAPAGWSLAVTSEWNNVKVAIYYRPNNPGGRTSETFTCSPGYHDMTLYILEYAGMAATNALDKTALNGGPTNSGYVQTGFTANTTQPKELVITALTTYTQTEFTTTPADGYTEVYDQFMLYHLTTAMYEKITTAIGSYGHGATVGVPAEWAGAVATFRGAN